MIILKLKGGLGNQMFQYAYGRKLMLQDKKEVIFDTSFFNGGKETTEISRPFLLGKFNIVESAIFQNEKEDFFGKIMRKIVSKITGDYGFYQNEKYFKSIEENIRKEFTLKDPLSADAKEWDEKIRKTRIPVSLHIRRGDYVKNATTNAYHGICDLTYYQKAYAELEKKIDAPFEIFVFSDDINWAKENLKLPCLMHFVSNPNIPDYEELILMSTCKHHIIANSSFSWWGAWLDQNPEKIVIAPEQWTSKKRADMFVPSNWIKIKNT